MESPRSKASAAASKTGRDFEGVILEQFKAYEAAGLAVAEQLHTPTRPVWTKAGMMRRAVGQAPVDFCGVMGPASRFPQRALYVECKHTTKRACSLRIVPRPPKGEKPKGNKVGLRMEQLERCVTLHRFGAVVAVLWRNHDAVGILTGEAMVHALAHAATVKTIHRREFVWLDRRDTDFLPTLQGLYVR